MSFNGKYIFENVCLVNVNMSNGTNKMVNIRNFHTKSFVINDLIFFVKNTYDHKKTYDYEGSFNR